MNKHRVSRKNSDASSQTKRKTRKSVSASKSRTDSVQNPQGKSIRKRVKHKVRKGVLAVLVVMVLGLGCCAGSCISSMFHSSYDYDPYLISADVHAHEPLLRSYASMYGISEYVPVLMAIMQAESGGQGNDVMQSSESLGLPVNTLDREASIKQGVKFFSELVEEAKERNLDLPSIIQAYNYGRGFLQFVEENGGAYSFQTASEFGRIHSGGRTVEYPNPLAIERNGGWRWAYGNMFYYPVVQKYLDNNF